MAADVCVALGLNMAAGASPHLKKLSPDQRRMVSRSTLNRIEGSFPNAGANCISESGLYSLVNRSDKAQARPFHAPLARQDWVNREVLPAIRNAHYVLLVLLNG